MDPGGFGLTFKPDSYRDRTRVAARCTCNTRHTVASLRHLAFAFVQSNFNVWFASAMLMSHLELCTGVL